MRKTPSTKSKQSIPSYLTDSTSPETDDVHEDNESNYSGSFVPTNEPTPYDEKGRCTKHPHIRLRRKKMLGGWKVVMTHCPDCCIEQMLAMRNEQYGNKGRNNKGVEQRRRSSSRESQGSRSQGRNQRKGGAGSRSGTAGKKKNMPPPISQLTIRTNNDGGGAGENGSDCGSMASSASEITYGTNGGRSNNSAGLNSGGSGNSNEYPQHVTRMPFTDAYGDKGWYTGEVASVSGLPHGKGTLHYCDGRVRGGLWSNGMAGGTPQQQQQRKRGGNGGSVSSPPHGARPSQQQQQQQQQRLQHRERRRPIVKTDMPWTDLIGESGLYSGETDENGEPHGMGMMRYHDGSALEGEWYHGELERRRD